jgi:inosose dehydratase
MARSSQRAGLAEEMSVAIELAYQANCWGPLGGDAVGVTSITQLTYRTFGDMGLAIREIGAAGYAGVELFDGNLLDYVDRQKEFRAVLDRTGVRLVAVYSGANFIFDDILEEELARIERAATVAADFGAVHLVVGGGAKRVAGNRPDDMERLGAALDRTTGIAERAGLRAHYHPHLTTIVERPESVLEIFRHTAIGFCPDTAHLAAAGGDPVGLVRALNDRISYVHVKGFQRQPFAFTPLDAGDLDNGAVLRTLLELGYDGWITTELDSWPNPADGAVRSRRFIGQIITQ